MNINYVPAKVEQERAARTLFAIVWIFGLCSLPRIVLNLEECISMIISYSNIFTSLHTFETASQSVRCYSPPEWSYAFNCISEFLLVANASVGSIIYCIMSLHFRMEFVKRCQTLNFCK